MLVGGLLLFWLPFVGPFIAGVVGGRIAGSAGRGTLAALLPTIIAAAFVIIISLLTGPVGFLGGIFAGIGLFIFGVFHGLALLLGGFIGGAL